MSRSVVADEGALAGEVSEIVASSRRNNKRKALTGALLVHGRAFVQVLEGARAAVEDTFERILCDPRHEDISVLQCEFVDGRFFADWDMACVERLEQGITLLGKLSREPSHRFSPTEGDTFCATLLAVINGEGNGAVVPAPPRSLGHRETAPGRSEAPRSTKSNSQPEQPDPQILVLRRSLDEERYRTTALRQELDDAHVALAEAHAAVEAGERHRDIWADRSRQMRTTLAEIRGELKITQSQRDELKDRLSACEFERNRLRVQRDIWAERTRSLARSLCREPALHDEEERPIVAADGPRLSVVPN